MSFYHDNRARFLKTLGQQQAAAVIPTASLKVRNDDSDYPFRPSSDFWYLTGFGETDAVLVLLPFGQAERNAKGVAKQAPHGEPQALLFMRDKDKLQEIWHGRRLGVEAATQTLGVDAAYSFDELWERLPKLLAGYGRVLYRTGEESDRDRQLMQVLKRLRNQSKRGLAAPNELIDPSPWLHEQRLFKQPAEIEVMQRAADISVEAHLAAMRAVQPGMHEYEVQALLEYTFKKNGANGSAYSSIVGGGENACILHYVENNCALNDGELLLIDAGAEFDCYAADITRTFPINGHFSPEQRALYEVVLASQKAAIATLKPGTSYNAMHHASLEVLVDGLLDLGLLKGSRAEAIEKEAYRPFYMHGIGHWLGLDVHDCGAYQLDGDYRALEPGMVTTVEPGLYIAPDDESVEARWRGIGIRIEDDVLITADGNRVLTAALPKEADEVEAVCNEAALRV